MSSVVFPLAAIHGTLWHHYSLAAWHYGMCALIGMNLVSRGHPFFFQWVGQEKEGKICLDTVPDGEMFPKNNMAGQQDQDEP